MAIFTTLKKILNLSVSALCSTITILHNVTGYIFVITNEIYATFYVFMTLISGPLIPIKELPLLFLVRQI